MIEASSRCSGTRPMSARSSKGTSSWPATLPRIRGILYGKCSVLLGGRDTIDHHAALIELCARGDVAAAATLSADHWSRLGGLPRRGQFESVLPGPELHFEPGCGDALAGIAGTGKLART